MTPARASVRFASALLAGSAAAVLLAGCSLFGGGSSTPGGSSHATGSSSASPSQSTSPSATPSPTPTPTPTPVTLQQNQVWTLDQVYQFNPNFLADPNYKVASGSAAAQLVALSGVSYGWATEQGDQKIEVAVAHPADGTLPQYEGQLPSADNVPIDNAPANTLGYFDPGTHTLEVFTPNGYWIVIDSASFAEPGDAYPVATDVMGNLK